MIECLPRSDAAQDWSEDESGTMYLEDLSDEQSKYLPALPLEVVNKIITCLTSLGGNTQSDLSACCLLSKTWYAAAVRPLYDNPCLSSSIFGYFMRTVCATTDGRVRDIGLVKLITVLDMRGIADLRGRSAIPKLLGRVKDTVEVFVAPKTSFRYATSWIASTPMVPCV